MQFDELTPEEQQVLASWCGAMRDWCRVRQELTDGGRGLKDRYAEDIDAIFAKLDADAVIDDGQWHQGKKPHTKTEFLQLGGQLDNDLTEHDTPLARQKYEAASGRSVSHGNYQLP